jgi:dihydroorotate dehydrogenase
VSRFDTVLSKAARLLEPETAHKAAIVFLKTVPFKASLPGTPVLAQTVCGLHFPNPIGLAAGFDKNAEVPDALLARGFGFVEVGTITPKPQAGNPRPRLFRLSEQQALINRFGFNNDGIEACVKRLAARQLNVHQPAGIVGVNIGANKDSADRIADYVLGIGAFSALADYFTINVSSPNTPGLRGLQTREALLSLTEAVLEARAKHTAATGRTPPVFVKIAPDLDDAELKAISAVALSSGIDGMIISNTTLARPVPQATRHAEEQGGFSGDPLFQRSTVILARMRSLVGPDMTLIGVGGINSAERALAKIEAGANLVQLYTGMVYGGFGLQAKICRELQALVEAANVGNIAALSGIQTDKWAAKAIEA